MLLPRSRELLSADPYLASIAASLTRGPGQATEYGRASGVPSSHTNQGGGLPCWQLINSRACMHVLRACMLCDQGTTNHMHACMFSMHACCATKAPLTGGRALLTAPPRSCDIA